MIDPTESVGREIDHRPQRPDERERTTQHVPPNETMIVRDERGSMKGREGIPIATRECTGERGIVHRDARVRRRFAGPPARVELGVGGIERILIEVDDRDGIAARVRSRSP